MSTPVLEFMTKMPHTVGSDLGINTARDMMDQYSCHHLPVLAGGHLVGILSDRDLRTVESLTDSRAITIEDIMTEEPVVVNPLDDVFQVAMLMHQKKIGSVIVSATENTPWGIFTATDALKFFTDKQN